MLAVGRGVEHEVERLGDGADTLQGAPQERGEIGALPTRDEPVRSKEDSWLRGMIQVSYGTRGA